MLQILNRTADLRVPILFIAQLRHKSFNPDAEVFSYECFSVVEVRFLEILHLRPLSSSSILRCSVQRSTLPLRPFNTLRPQGRAPILRSAQTRQSIELVCLLGVQSASEVKLLWQRA